MPNDLTAAADIPVGDIQLYDDYVPALDAGNWYIQVTHALTKGGAAVNAEALGALQEFIVSAPQFALDPSEVLSFYPPAGATGRFGETLPNVVLREPLLPWERAIPGAKVRQPWLALLVFEQSELSAGDAGSDVTPTRVFNTTVGDFLKPDPQGKLLKPQLTRADDVAASAPCAYIRVPVPVFLATAPRLEELRYLAHCRQVNTGDKAIAGLNEHGLFSVVVANRFPAVPSSPDADALLNVAHLVSLEGLGPHLRDGAAFGNFQEVALISLASWTFQSLPDNREDFRGLVTNLLYPAGAESRPYPPEHFWLRLPPAALDEAEPAQAEAARRLRDGFVPLGYHTRTGEETFAWYRGPLTPLLTTPLQKGEPFMTADAAAIYQPAQGVFDFSLAAAWNIGRSLALADRSFGQLLFGMRRAAHRLTDRLYQRLQSDHFSQTEIAALDQETTVQDEFLKVLDTQLIQDVGAAATDAVQPAAPEAAGDSARAAQDAPPDTDPKAAVENFLNDPGVQQRILELVKTDLGPVAQWLAQLLLLAPTPFTYLVPDERMLPVESLRFFYLDNNWLDAMLDGALSVGTESSRDTFFNTVTRDLIRRSAYEAVLAHRKNLPGVDPPAHHMQMNLMSGLLLRSGLVSGWPSLSVRPCLDGGQILKTLRMTHLSPNVLLCIFWGVPDYVEISEPQEGFAFGTDEDGRVALRHPSGPDIGAQLSGDPTLPVRDLAGGQKLFMRAASSRVLDLSPESPAGLVQGLKAGLEAQLKTTLAAFGPADLALQMVKAPEAIRLNCRTT